MSDIAAPVAPVVAPVTPTATVPAVETPKAPEVKADAPKAAPKAAEAKAPRHKLVIDGKEEEVELDELIKRAQKATAADKRFQESAQAKKEAAEKHSQVAKALRLAKEDPVKFAKELGELLGEGFDEEDFATKILERRLMQQIEAEQEKLMTPEQRKAKDLERKVAEYERQEQARKADEVKKAQEAKQAEHKQAVAKARQTMENTIMAALEKTSLPKTPQNALALLEQIQIAHERGIPYNAESLAKDLESAKQSELKALLAATKKTDWLPPEVIEEVKKLAVDDPKLAEAIRKKAVAEFKKSNPMAAAKPVTGTAAEKPRAPKKGQSMNAAMKDLMLLAAKRG